HPPSTLSPYTTLFRSRAEVDQLVMGRIKTLHLHQLPVHLPGGGAVVFVGEAVHVEGQQVVPRRNRLQRQAAVVQQQLVGLVELRSEEHTSELQSRSDL